MSENVRFHPISGGVAELRCCRGYKGSARALVRDRRGPPHPPHRAFARQPHEAKDEGEAPNRTTPRPKPRGPVGDGAATTAGDAASVRRSTAEAEARGRPRSGSRRSRPARGGIELRARFPVVEHRVRAKRPDLPDKGTGSFERGASSGHSDESVGPRGGLSHEPPDSAAVLDGDPSGRLPPRRSPRGPITWIQGRNYRDPRMACLWPP
jgi:hypothetical protein